MSVTENLTAVLAELARAAEQVDEAPWGELIGHIETAHHVFVAGAGRSGLAAAGFANRLLHLGFSVSMVGELTSPHSRPGDLLLVSSASGATERLVALAAKARTTGVRVAVVTTNPDSALAAHADVTVVLPGASKLTRGASLQPMGSAFEQLSFLVFDALVLELMARRGETSETMVQRHADLE